MCMPWPRGRCSEPARKHPGLAVIPPNPGRSTPSSTAWSRSTATLFRPSRGQQRRSVDVTKSGNLRLTYTSSRTPVDPQGRQDFGKSFTDRFVRYTCRTCWGFAASLPTSSGPSHVFNSLLAVRQRLPCRERESGVPEPRRRSDGCRSTLSTATRETHWRSGQP